MLKFLQIPFAVITVSFFIFPFNLPFVEGVNTKMILAVIGLSLFFLDQSTQRKFTLSKDFLILSLLCAAISVWALLVTTMNRTEDYAFASYLVSVWVWFGGAYAVVWLIRRIHGELNITLISHYLIVVSVVQCILAYSMTLFPPLKSFIDGLMGDSSYMGVVEGRVYGLGAALDPAGLRFAAVLVILAYLVCKINFNEKIWIGIFYLASFVIITVFGDIISRTTTVGAVIGIVYLLIHPLLGEKMPNPGAFYVIAAPLLLLFIGVSIWLYQTDLHFRTELRFGFEGFFSLVEKGRWEVRSNNNLRRMIIWPDSLKTWVIGDGYFANPADLPNRFGQVSGGFYMHTDIGYLRYIFYFGLIGLMGMIAAVVQMTVTCCKFFKEHRWVFIMLLLVTLIGWLKVSSDIIMIFAPFLMLAYLSYEQNEKTPSNQSCN